MVGAVAIVLVTTVLAHRFVRPIRRLGDRAAAIARGDWFGNVRKLRNAIEHAMILARGGAIAPEHLPPLMISTSARKKLDELRIEQPQEN